MSAVLLPVLSSLVLPPGLVLVVLALVWWLIPRHTRLARVVLVFGALLLYISTIQAPAYYLSTRLERYHPLTLEQVKSSPAQAIVVLGSGRESPSRFLGDATLTSDGMDRVRYAARLRDWTGLPLLATGGSPDHEAVSEAELMKKVFEADLHTPVQWVEDKSNNTWENALFSRQILARSSIAHIILVTQAFHMPRSVWAFEKVGFLVTPAPTPYNMHRPGLSLGDWLPKVTAGMRLPLHEYIGMLWYRLRHGEKGPVATARAGLP
ncbi:MAG: YdcF family protein [Magnetococcales bacterium]|nr:YdcF family protein [Magnetococcales bacterium]